MQISTVRLSSVDDVFPLARTARAEGFAFLDRLVQEWEEGINRFDGDGEALFGAYVDGKLVATAGITRQGPHLGRLRRVYIDPEFRRQGIARLLMAQVLRFATGIYDEMVLFTDTEHATTFYERLGFIPESPDGPDHATHRLRLVQ